MLHLFTSSFYFKFIYGEQDGGGVRSHAHLLPQTYQKKKKNLQVKRLTQNIN